VPYHFIGSLVEHPVAPEDGVKEEKEAAPKPRAGSVHQAGCTAVELRHGLFPHSLVELFTASPHDGLGVKVCISAAPFASSVAIDHGAWEEGFLEYFNVFSLLCAELLGRWDVSVGLPGEAHLQSFLCRCHIKQVLLK